MLQVYEYVESDIDTMKFNYWARLLKNNKSLKKIKAYLSSRNTYSYTLCEDKKPIAIVSFHEYEPDCYDGFIVASDEFKKPAHAIKMKWLITRLAEGFGAVRVQTSSENNSQLNKWHTFLGFKLEKENHFKHKGINYNLWSKSWEQEQH